MHSRPADDRLTTKLFTNEPIKELEDAAEEKPDWISAAAQGACNAGFFQGLQDSVESR